MSQNLPQPGAPEIPREFAAILQIKAKVKTLPLIEQQRVALLTEQIAALLAAEQNVTVRVLSIAMANLAATVDLKEQAKGGGQ